ncbi:MAG: hypothetical protein R2771_06845 [Saprospiraceae bacterium]
MISKYYPSKVLLFGEYLVLSGANALAIPFDKFKGNFTFDNVETDPIIDEFYNFLKSQDWYSLNTEFNISKFNYDIKSGLNFVSNIPIGYGIGSSGAVSAAIYERYFTPQKSEDLFQLKKILAQIENFFHSSSSGIDPLVSFLNNPVKINSDSTIEKTKFSFSNYSDFDFYLVDSGTSRTTAEYVKIFKEKMSNSTFQNEFINKAISINNTLINDFLGINEKQVFEKFKEISHLQFHYLSEMIIDPITALWKNSLNNKDISIKLCGAGGGGFYLAICKKEIELQELYHTIRFIKLKN